VNELTVGRKPLFQLIVLVAPALYLALELVHAEDPFHARLQEPSANMPSFDVASIKPGRPGFDGVRLQFTPDGFMAEDIPLQLLIREAFGVKDDQVSGLPNWGKTENYDVNAKVSSFQQGNLTRLSSEQRRSMLVLLLADRFKLRVHHESKELPIYALVIAKGGPKLRVTGVGSGDQRDVHGDTPQPGVMLMGPGRISGQGIPIASLVKMLSGQNLGRPIVDKTGLTGNYDFALKWTPEGGSTFTGASDGKDVTHSDTDSGPTIFTAIQEQLGLKIESQKGPVDTLVIDHVERPSPN
jgi:uncharacterized protein (TIGR03435 family)